MESQTQHSHAPNQRRRRGPNINKKASHILDKIVVNQPHAWITLRKDTYTKKFVGDSAVYFATEVGIVMRKLSNGIPYMGESTERK
uniref:Uncharacterized protein n=1 Tax=Lactuca sativa TaxID=4236 RepID=A0A9R1WXF9_LACSA|nr:hypothetical protein LSAT_V11C800438720 [Lactuca sativa]